MDDVFMYARRLVQDVDLTRGGFVIITARDAWGNPSASQLLNLSQAMAVCDGCRASHNTGAAGTVPQSPSAQSPSHSCELVVGMRDVNGDVLEGMAVRHVGMGGDASQTLLPTSAASELASQLAAGAGVGMSHLVQFPWGSSITTGPRLCVWLRGSHVPGSPFWVPLPDSYVKRVGGGYDTAAGIAIAT